MLVKNFLCDVMRLIGRPDAAEEIEVAEEGDALPDEIMRMQRAMLICLNAILDELARGYFPLKATQSLTSATGEHSYSEFENLPYRIISVSQGGEKIEYVCQPLKLVCAAGEVEVEYEYVPAALALTDELSYPDGAVSPALIGYGVASEYMLIAGGVGRAEMWEGRYRAEIDRQLSLRPVSGRIPPRRWL